MQVVETKREQERAEETREAEEAAINLVIEQLHPEEVEELVRQAVAMPPRADRPAEPDLCESVRPGQGLRAGGRRAGRRVIGLRR